MLNLKTILSQVSRAGRSEFRTDTSVSLTDFGGGKSLTKGQKLSKTRQKNKKTIHLASYNTRTMRSEKYLTNLKKELQNIKWDILMISETRLSGEAVTILKSGHLLFQKNSNKNAHIGGVALMIHKRIKHLITKTKAILESFI